MQTDADVVSIRADPNQGNRSAVAMANQSLHERPKRRPDLERHGHRVGGQASRAYNAWRGMHKRCFNKKHKSYQNYGARGISICAEWRDFINFHIDMGDPPSGLTLDRIDNDRGYEPGNCRWATPAQQARNRRSTRLTVALVKEIRAGLSAGRSRSAIAAEYQVSEAHIAHIARGEKWASL